MGRLAIFSAGADPKNHFFGGAVTAGGWGPFLRGALYRVSLSKIFPLSKPSPFARSRWHPPSSYPLCTLPRQPALSLLLPASPFARPVDSHPLAFPLHPLPWRVLPLASSLCVLFGSFSVQLVSIAS